MMIALPRGAARCASSRERDAGGVLAGVLMLGEGNAHATQHQTLLCRREPADSQSFPAAI